MDFQAAHPQRSSVIGAYHTAFSTCKVGVRWIFADWQGGGVAVNQPEAFEILEGNGWCWFGWFAWVLLVGWCVWFGLFGWWNSHFWRFWPWKDVCCWECFDGYFKHGLCFEEILGGFHSIASSWEATLHMKNDLKKRSYTADCFAKSWWLSLSKYQLICRKKLEIMRVRCSNLVSYHTPFVASS